MDFEGGGVERTWGAETRNEKKKKTKKEKNTHDGADKGEEP